MVTIGEEHLSAWVLIEWVQEHYPSLEVERRTSENHSCLIIDTVTKETVIEDTSNYRVFQRVKQDDFSHVVSQARGFGLSV